MNLSKNSIAYILMMFPYGIFGIRKPESVDVCDIPKIAGLCLLAAFWVTIVFSAIGVWRLLLLPVYLFGKDPLQDPFEEECRYRYQDSEPVDSKVPGARHWLYSFLWLAALLIALFHWLDFRIEQPNGLWAAPILSLVVLCTCSFLKFLYTFGAATIRATRNGFAYIRNKFPKPLQGRPDQTEEKPSKTWALITAFVKAKKEKYCFTIRFVDG